ncbi:MAG: 50S ribosomal protein L18e [Candidatus Altiarchaeota archaeon]|nr:50S ribosomal protein L18e [Candidatus Altiarchaeota archaeon]
MPRTYEFEDPRRVDLMDRLREAARVNDAGIWKALAEELSRSRKDRHAVNLWKVNKYTKKGDTVLVPGKLLGDGVLDHRVDVAAFKVSESAKDKVEAAGGKVISIHELVEKNPKGSNIVMIG